MISQLSPQIPRNRATDEVQEHHGLKDVALLWQNTKGAKGPQLRNFPHRSGHSFVKICGIILVILLGGKDTNNNQ